MQSPCPLNGEFRHTRVMQIEAPRASHMLHHADAAR